MGTASKSEIGRKGFTWISPSTKETASQGLRAHRYRLATIDGLTVTKGYSLARFSADLL